MKLSRNLSIFFLSLFVLLSFNSYAAVYKNNNNKNNNNQRGNVVSDTVITGKVKAKIAADPNVSVFKVGVTTRNGVVMLDGMVNSDTDASALIEMAQSVDGVRDVDTSQFKVKNSSQPFTDTVITAKVKGIYIREKLLGKDVPAVNVGVETNNGVVYLSGSVANQEQATNAINIAKSVDGVKQVESRIKINEDQANGNGSNNGNGYHKANGTMRNQNGNGGNNYNNNARDDGGDNYNNE